jgi:hypothetical protein
MLHPAIVSTSQNFDLVEEIPHLISQFISSFTDQISPHKPCETTERIKHVDKYIGA